MPLMAAKKVADTGSGVDRVKVPDNGKKTLRFLQPLDEVMAHYVHWVELPSTSGKSEVRSFECLRDEEGSGRCPICEKGDENSRKRSARIAFIVMDRRPGEGEKAVGVMEMGKRFFNDLEAIEEEWGPVTGLDIQVIVTGVGKNRKYSVLPTSKKAPLGPMETAALASIDLANLVPDGLTYESILTSYQNFIRTVSFDPERFGADPEEEAPAGAGDETDEF